MSMFCQDGNILIISYNFLLVKKVSEYRIYMRLRGCSLGGYTVFYFLESLFQFCKFNESLKSRRYTTEVRFDQVLKYRILILFLFTKKLKFKHVIIKQWRLENEGIVYCGYATFKVLLLLVDMRISFTLV